MKTLLSLLLILGALLGQAQTKLGIADALKTAAENRSSVRAMRLGLEQAQANARAYGAYLPTTLGVGGSSRGEVGATDGDLFLSQPIDLFGRASAGRKVGLAHLKLAEATYKGELLQLQSEVLDAYVNAVAASDLSESADLLLKVAEGLLSATRRRFEEGKVAEVQLIRANIELERARQAASLRASGKAAALRRLAGALGIHQADVESGIADALSPIAALEVKDRPDILALIAQADIAEAEAQLVSVERRPELEFQLRRSPWNDSRAYYGARIQLTWALFDHGKSKAESDAARKKAASAKALIEDARKHAISELAAIQVEIEAERAQVASYEKILSSARDLVEKSQRGYGEGFGTQVDVLESTRALREIEQELVEARQRLALTTVQQYRAAGFLMEGLR
ncbi:MAG: TolC family protein [Fimbriimonadaceae bacterium]|nr:TolC family protein [Fimbriimonadaceae bacterium]